MANNLRVWHYLSHNAATRCPSNLLFVQTESYSVYDSPQCITHSLRLWTACSIRLVNGKQTRQVWKNGDTTESFWTFVTTRLDKRRPLWVFTYNAALNYNILQFAKQLESESFLLDRTTDVVTSERGLQRIVESTGLLVLNPQSTIIECWHKETGCKVILIDVQNYYRCTMDELSESTGLDRDKQPKAGDDDETWLRHCTRDTEIVKEAMCDLIQTVKRHDLGNFRYTLPAQALQAYRHRFMQHKILVHCNENALKLERGAYFGGNCTVYRYGIVHGPIYCLDANSFYPSVCIGHRLPHRLLKYFSSGINPRYFGLCGQNWIIARVRWNHSNACAPVRFRGRLVMARGRFCTTLHLPEIAEGLKHGAIEKVYCFSIYEANKIFKRYMSEMFWLRKEQESQGKHITARLLKLLANALPGKFGQRQIEWVDRPDQEPLQDWGEYKHVDICGNNVYFWRSIAGKVQRKRNYGECAADFARDSKEPGTVEEYINNESTNSCPAIAGAITSWGRVILHELIHIAGENNVYYTDTDSLHVNAKGFDALSNKDYIHDSAIGRLSVRGVYQSVEYRGCKFYRLDDTWTINGVKPTANQIADKVWQQQEFSGWPSFVSHGPEVAVKELTTIVDRSDEWIPGTILPDGRILPVELNIPETYHDAMPDM